MAQTYKVLGQAAPSAVTLTTLYTVPGDASSVLSTISVCNRGLSTGSFRVAVRPAGETLADKHYVVYDSAVYANDTVFLSVGLTLAASDVVSCYASSSDFSFSVFGSEVV